jgi:hypothetical protein
MYPNPATDELFFNNLSSDYDVSIYDVKGRLVLHAQIDKSDNSISIESLKSGMYFVQFVNAKTAENISKKLIVR